MLVPSPTHIRLREVMEDGFRLTPISIHRAEAPSVQLITTLAAPPSVLPAPLVSVWMSFHRWVCPAPTVAVSLFATRKSRTNSPVAEVTVILGVELIWVSPVIVPNGV